MYRITHGPYTHARTNDKCAASSAIVHPNRLALTLAQLANAGVTDAVSVELSKEEYAAHVRATFATIRG